MDESEMMVLAWEAFHASAAWGVMSHDCNNHQSNSGHGKLNTSLSLL